MLATLICFKGICILISTVHSVQDSDYAGHPNLFQRSIYAFLFLHNAEDSDKLFTLMHVYERVPAFLFLYSVEDSYMLVTLICINCLCILIIT